ncbi:hypothetical protein ACH5RR_002701 [Cinchona calisaya]|uniref:Uncharacterized protein n=1 Tax=Cinchona calisaya TaxID=153742 RepID=A0ABD3ASR3_9GENT
MFNQAIARMSPKLQVYKKYLISNAKVRPILSQFRCDGIDTQWVISTNIVVEELPDEQDLVLPVEFNYTQFNDLAQYADSTTHSVDVLGVIIDALSILTIKNNNKTSYVQRFILINEKAIENEKCFADLIKKKDYRKKSPQMFYQKDKKITSFSFQHIFQRYWYMACKKCFRSTSTTYKFVYTYNHYNGKQEAEPRCRFDIDLKDDDRTITASIFADLVENLFGYSAVEAMEHFNQNKEPPLQILHEELK